MMRPARADAVAVADATPPSLRGMYMKRTRRTRPPACLPQNAALRGRRSRRPLPRCARWESTRNLGPRSSPPLPHDTRPCAPRPRDRSTRGSGPSRSGSRARARAAEVSQHCGLLYRPPTRPGLRLALYACGLWRGAPRPSRALLFGTGSGGSATGRPRVFALPPTRTCVCMVMVRGP